MITLKIFIVCFHKVIIFDSLSRVLFLMEGKRSRNQKKKKTAEQRQEPVTKQALV